MSLFRYNLDLCILPRNFLGIYRKFNTHLGYYPIPKKMTIMQELEGFNYLMALHLNMVYYTICLDPTSQSMCTIITPRRKCKYLRLPIDIMCVSDIFQENMSNLMEGLEFTRIYLKDFYVFLRDILMNTLKT